MNAVMLDLQRLDRPDTVVRQQPFPFMIAHGLLPEEVRDDLERGLPALRGGRFLSHDPGDCGPSLNTLIKHLTSPRLAATVGRHLGIDDLGGYPTLVTLCRALNRRHGTIHTDSKSKIATALLYLNPAWPDTSAGCLRFLNAIDNIDDVIEPELKPLYGEFAVFKRCDNSFHGHLPYQGERRVIQVAWLTSEEEKLRKTRRGKFSRMFKKLFSGLDRKVGAGRDRNASHRD